MSKIIQKIKILLTSKNKLKYNKHCALFEKTKFKQKTRFFKKYDPEHLIVYNLFRKMLDKKKQGNYTNYPQDLILLTQIQEKYNDKIRIFNRDIDQIPITYEEYLNNKCRFPKYKTNI